MSFILDALKKSESDRQRQSSPALFEVKVAAPRRRFSYLTVSLGGLLGLTLLVLAWVLLRPGTQVTAATTAAPASAPPAATAAPGMVTVPATSTYIPANAAPSVTVMPNNPEVGVVAPSHAPPLAEEPVLAGGEPSVPPDYDARDYAPAITPAQAGATAAARRSGSLPSRDEVLAQGTQLPDLRLDLHVYDADPAKRFVFINMHRLREGETLPEGVRVEAITQTGAKLSYRGTEFALEGN